MTFLLATSTLTSCLGDIKATSTVSSDIVLLASAKFLLAPLSPASIFSRRVLFSRTRSRTSDSNDIYSYGFAFTSSDLDDAVKSLSDLQKDMIHLAEVEKSCQLMAAEIEKTRRRVNALEHVMIPEYRKNIKYITMKLDEAERSSQIRLMKVKDMMLEEAHNYSEKESAS